MTPIPRRPRGTGTIAYQPSHHRYRGQLRVGGERRYVYGATSEEVDTALRHLLADVERGRVPKKRTPLTVEAFLETWLAERVKPRRSPKTHATYKGYIKNHVTPAIGSHQLATLTPAHVQKMIDGIHKAPRTVRQIRAILRAALEHALRHELVSRNVAKLTEGPSVPPSHIQPLTPVQARILLAKLRDDQHEGVYVIAMGCGLRLGEILGLRWWTGAAGVNLDSRYLIVAEELQRTDGIYVLKQPKTPGSARRIVLPPFVVAAILRQRERQNTWRSEFLEHDPDAVFNDWGLVFTTKLGKPVNGSWITHRLYDILEKAKLPRQRFHDLRHLYASVLIDQGADLKEVKDQLGHSQVSLTADLYGHLYDAARQRAARRIQRGLG